jgi:hypothetical protein
LAPHRLLARFHPVLFRPGRAGQLVFDFRLSVGSTERLESRSRAHHLAAVRPISLDFVTLRIPFHALG